VVVFQVAVTVEPVTLWFVRVVPPVWSTKLVGEPWTLPADMLMVMVPLTVLPLVGLVMAAVSGAGGGGVPPAEAPEAFTGDVASLKMVIFADTVWLPAASVATALTS
jgi:hypothetical protein